MCGWEMCKTYGTISFACIKSSLTKLLCLSCFDFIVAIQGSCLNMLHFFQRQKAHNSFQQNKIIEYFQLMKELHLKSLNWVNLWLGCRGGRQTRRCTLAGVSGPVNRGGLEKLGITTANLISGGELADWIRLPVLIPFGFTLSRFSCNHQFHSVIIIQLCEVNGSISDKTSSWNERCFH